MQETVFRRPERNFSFARGDPMTRVVELQPIDFDDVRNSRGENGLVM